MRRIGKLKRVHNDEDFTFELDERVDLLELARLSDDDSIVAEIRFNDNRIISAEQRKKAWALIGDISRWSGYSMSEASEQMKIQYMLEADIDFFSLSDCSVSTAREFISYMIEFAFKWDIPFKDKGITLTDDENKFLWLCIKHRKCVVCGKKADVHHVDAVGMGRDRRTVNNTENRLMAVCREHHNAIEYIGQEEFDRVNHVQGILLNARDLKEFRIQGVNKDEKENEGNE